MNRTDGRREKLGLLLEKIGLTGEEANSDFADGLLDRVEVSAASRRWTFFIRKTSVLPARQYSLLVSRARETFGPIADVEFVLEYDPETDTDQVLRAHWDNFVEWAASEIVSVNGWLGKAGIETDGGRLTVVLLDEMGLELARKRKIDEAAVRFFERRFRRSCKVKLMAGDSGRGEYERFLQEREQADRELVQALMQSAAAAAPPERPAAERLVYGYEIRDEPVPISSITEEEKRITVQGTVFGLETRELRNGNTLYTFNVTDYTDSIMMKVFAKSKDDAAVLSLLKDGIWIRARGRVEYDKFMAEPELVMMPNDLHEVPAPPERMDTAEQKRVEFHLHTTMSQMDAVTPVDAYIKTAAKWGHPAIAISDHANVHCYPEAFKAAKKHNMKVIFGVEANVVDDQVEIVLNPREEPLASAEYVVFDIETTGLSILNSKIIELAGVKMRDGKVTGKFETFINPHEPIPYNIQQLTNITDDMVKDAPELEPKLREFVEFVGDAVLVAHNARFDIGFIQA
ncbi:MAG: PolC-type DNA polymerase III, partial [Paenibacillaceae bacterium]